MLTNKIRKIVANKAILSLQFAVANAKNIVI
jgi:hypothetical protein